MDLGLDKLNSLLLEMASTSQDAVSSAIEAYNHGTRDTKVRELSEQLRSLHRQVSDLCMELMARYQPVASDLRLIKASFEISYGFYRYGRYAKDIVEVLEIFGDLSDCDHSMVTETAQKTQEMIKMSVEAFAKRDVALARQVPRMDDFVDDRYRKHLRAVIEKSGDLKCHTSAALILRYLERISDHASYIAESVEYIVTGTEPAH
jgi:phosphate transport system protein